MAIRASYGDEDDAERFLRGRGITPEMDARARKAAEVFNLMLPTMASFAKMLTGRKIQVVAYAGIPCTDGNTIFMRAPIELGDRTPHLGGSKCDGRDPHTDRPLCPACVIREDVMITLYHEIAHIAFNSFDAVTDEDKAELIERAVKESVLAIETKRANLQKLLEDARRAGDLETEAAVMAEDGYLLDKLSTREEKIADRLNKLPVRSYLEAARAVSPYLPMMVNALEDVRVNHKMYQARKGTFRMFRGQAIRVFGEGIQQEDGTFSKWIDMPRNAQMIVALLAKAAGYEEYRNGWFMEDVIEALEDPELCGLLKHVETLPNAASVYRLAFPVLERVRKLGFCKAIDDVEDDPKPEPAPGKEKKDEKGTAEGDGEGAGSGGGVPEDDDEDEDTSSGSEAGSSGAGGSTEQDEDEDEEHGGSDADPTDSGEREDGPDGSAGGQDDADEDEDGSGDSDGEDGSDGEDESAEDDHDIKCGGITWDGDMPEAEAKDGKDGKDSDPTVPADADADADEAEAAMNAFGGHGATPPPTPQEQAEQDAVDRAITQAKDFDCPSQKVFGVAVHRFNKHVMSSDGEDLTAQLGWNPYFACYGSYYGMDLDKTAEGILGPSMLRMRAAFAENKTASVQRNRKSGLIDTAVLGRRAPVGDDRLFMKRKYPGKKDYFVCIGGDLSGSTSSGAIRMIKEAMLAQAELCHRTGVPFAVYGHTGSYRGGSYTGSLNVDIFVVKEENEAWDSAARERLRLLTPASANLDGHTLEFYRKRCDQSLSTDKIIMYYTDGAMPCENHDEELTVLQREIKTCREKGYTLLGVGVKTDSPKRHGLETVCMNSLEDTAKVVAHLAKKLAVRRVA